ncbi:Phage virion morphogensis protein [uncultured Caudovirales phage]|uniref:Phage virion morphogensis protein n=1 Tax=uncultured Caudovirales phage TaxID=2100421 RepID=A0A6J5RPT4_9CAUD|nr:Phage virion morphogensis protein [uncultured Caudovirales phage]CAB4198032.1 Phage virion morphogensis protein [uncultured Caudovirales phage]CAB4210871.1 Phage virion morphogensis protein [uncultured Caudovirales phage]
MGAVQVDALFEDKDVAAFIKNMKKRLSQVEGAEKKFVGLLSAVVFRDVISHFEKQEGPDGAWAPWSDSYREHMEKIGRAGNQILQFSGRMRQNFKPGNYRGTKEGPLWFNDAQTQTGFPYAFAHNEGGSRLPKREFMFLGDDAVEDISKITLGFLLEEGV